MGLSLKREEELIYNDSVERDDKLDSSLLLNLSALSNTCFHIAHQRPNDIQLLALTDSAYYRIKCVETTFNAEGLENHLNQ